MPRRTNLTAVIVALAIAPSFGAAAALDEFPLSGTYMQNRPCHGDGTDAKPLLVTIREDGIAYRGGTCVMADKHLEGNKLSVRVTCTGRSGSVLSGEISFMRRDDNSLEMIAQDKNYRTVLNRCPNGTGTPSVPQTHSTQR